MKYCYNGSFEYCIVWCSKECIKPYGPQMHTKLNMTNNVQAHTLKNMKSKLLQWEVCMLKRITLSCATLISEMLILGSKWNVFYLARYSLMFHCRRSCVTVMLRHALYTLVCLCFYWNETLKTPRGQIRPWHTISTCFHRNTKPSSMCRVLELSFL